MYSGPLTVSSSTTLKAAAFKPDRQPSFAVTAEFSKLPHNRSIQLRTTYGSQYTGGGDMAMIDLIRGSDNFRTGAWQGYQGVDVDATVDLGTVQEIERISAGFLQDQGSWIFMPSEVVYSVSTDGVTFTPVGTFVNSIPPEQEGAVIEEFSIENIHQSARYVRLQARTIGVCPKWHQGAGGRAWIFVDEITIE